MESGEFIEKRKEKRTKKRFSIIDNDDYSPGANSDKKSLNISSEGLMFLSPSPYDLHKKVDFQLYLPMDRLNNFIFSFSIYGEIKWCKEFNKNYYRIGISFLNLPEVDKKFLEEYIYNLNTYGVPALSPAKTPVLQQSWRL